MGMAIIHVMNRLTSDIASVSPRRSHIRELTGSSSEIVHHDLPEDDPKVRQPDIALAKAKLGWDPKIKLEEGLTKTIAYFQEAGY